LTFIVKKATAIIINAITIIITPSPKTIVKIAPTKYNNPPVVKSFSLVTSESSYIDFLKNNELITNRINPIAKSIIINGKKNIDANPVWGTIKWNVDITDNPIVNGVIINAKIANIVAISAFLNIVSL